MARDMRRFGLLVVAIVALLIGIPLIAWLL